MGYSRLGQVPIIRQTVYQGQLVQPHTYPPAYMPYGYGGRFYRSQATSPAQPYQINFDPEAVEKAVYKDLPTDIKQKPSAAGTEPQKIIKLKSGLEVPQYLIQRDLARKKAEKAAAVAAATGPPPEIPPFFYKLGIFASEKPGQASALAIILGVFAGNIYFGMQKQ